MTDGLGRIRVWNSDSADPPMEQEMRMLRRISMLILVGSMMVVAPAGAHPVLKATNPAQNGAAIRSPTEIRLTFSERLIPQFSGSQVADLRGRVIANGTAVRNASDKRQLIVPLKVRLAPGRYRVIWHAVSADTHRIAGSYSFRVKG